MYAAAVLDAVKSAAVIALALAAAPAADNAFAPIPAARPVQVLESVRVEGTAPALPWPDGAQAAVGAAGLGVLAATQAARPLPTASVAKVMTALITLEQRPLQVGEQGPVITVTAQNVQDYRDQVSRGGSVVPVVAGEQLTEYQALQALLLPSANNVALLLARWISGSVATFVQTMNTRARQLGMTQTTFTDPSGLDPATVSVPADLVRLGEQAMTNPVLGEVVDQPEAVIPVAGRIPNVNQALGQHGIVGVKTGNSDEARAVYLAAATYLPAGGQPILTYAVVQGLATLSDCFAAAERLLDVVRGALRVETVVGRGQLLGRYVTPWRGESDIVAGADLRTLVWPGTAVAAELRAPALRVPVRPRAAAGVLQVSIAGRAATVPAALARGLAQPGLLWLVTRNASLSTLPAMELLTWLSLSLAVAAVLLALAALQHGRLDGPNVRLALVAPPPGEGWSVSETTPPELRGTCVGLLTNTGSHAGAAWAVRARVADTSGLGWGAAVVVGGDRRAGPETGRTGPDVVHVEPRSTIGLLVHVRLPLGGGSVEPVLAALRRSPGGIVVSMACGATRWPRGRPGRRAATALISQGDVVSTIERWAAGQARGPERGVGAQRGPAAAPEPRPGPERRPPSEPRPVPGGRPVPEPRPMPERRPAPEQRPAAGSRPDGGRTDAAGPPPQREGAPPPTGERPESGRGRAGETPARRPGQE